MEWLPRINIEGALEEAPAAGAVAVPVAGAAGAGGR
jgi:hypothetical protein